MTDLTAHLAVLVEKHYDLAVESIERNSRSGCLGDTFIVNNAFVLKLPRRGGVPWRPAGNVKFSSYVMHEANLHGIPCPKNVWTRQGLPYAHDPSLGTFHLMEKLGPGVVSEDQLPRKRMAFLLGLHSSLITLGTSQLFEFNSFKSYEYIDHWSLQASIQKLIHIFGLAEAASTDDASRRLDLIAVNLQQQQRVPDVLIEQIQNKEPLTLISLARKVMQRRKRLSRHLVVHCDIKPENVAFGVNHKTGNPEIQGSFDYTMCCLGNAAKNIAYTVVDSFLGVGKDKQIDYGEVLEVARGAMYGLAMEPDELLSVEDEILSACMKKYALRWEYWENEIRGGQRDYEVKFLDPRDMYQLFIQYQRKFTDAPLNNKLLELHNDLPHLGLQRACEFLRSDAHQKLRVSAPWEVRRIFGDYYEEALERYFNGKGS